MSDQDPLTALRGRGMAPTKVFIFIVAAAVLATCAWGMTRTDPGVVNNAFGVVLDVRVRNPSYTDTQELYISRTRVGCVPGTGRSDNPEIFIMASRLVPASGEDIRKSWIHNRPAGQPSLGGRVLWPHSAAFGSCGAGPEWGVVMSKGERGGEREKWNVSCGISDAGT